MGIWETWQECNGTEILCAESKALAHSMVNMSKWKKLHLRIAIFKTSNTMENMYYLEKGEEIGAVIHIQLFSIFQKT